jgi:hypothetical protein
MDGDTGFVQLLVANTEFPNGHPEIAGSIVLAAAKVWLTPRYKRGCERAFFHNRSKIYKFDSALEPARSDLHNWRIYFTSPSSPLRSTTNFFLTPIRSYRNLENYNTILLIKMPSLF